MSARDFKARAPRLPAHCCPHCGREAARPTAWEIAGRLARVIAWTAAAGTAVAWVILR